MNADQDRDVFRVDTTAAMRSTALHLHDEFEGVFSLETVQRFLHETYADVERQATVNRFLPLIAERRARTLLAELAHGAVGPHPTVLFLSRADAGRSRMAHAFLELRSHGAATAWAGVAEQATENPWTVQAMEEVGIRLPDVVPLYVTDSLVSAADVVVTLGGEPCPLLGGHHYEDWVAPGLLDRSLDDVRRTRDSLAEHVDRLVADLGIAQVA